MNFLYTEKVLTNIESKILDISDKNLRRRFARVFLKSSGFCTQLRGLYFLIQDLRFWIFIYSKFSFSFFNSITINKVMLKKIY